MVVACNTNQCPYNSDGNLCIKDTVMINGGVCSTIIDRQGNPLQGWSIHKDKNNNPPRIIVVESKDLKETSSAQGGEATAANDSRRSNEKV